MYIVMIINVGVLCESHHLVTDISMVPDTPVIEGKTVGVLSVDIDPITSLKQAWQNIFRTQICQ